MTPLESILDDMRRAVEVRLYYPALVVALTIPEVCSALTMDNSTFVKQEHYAAFVDKYTHQGGALPNGIGMKGIDCYRLRGGVVHRGNAAGHPFFGSTHVIFTIPETGGSIHAMSFVAGDQNATMIDLPRFCQAMDYAARQWLKDHASHPKVLENMPKLLSLRPNGMPPFFVGVPIVASGQAEVGDGRVLLTITDPAATR